MFFEHNIKLLLPLNRSVCYICVKLGESQRNGQIINSRLESIRVTFLNEKQPTPHSTVNAEHDKVFELKKNN